MATLKQIKASMEGSNEWVANRQAVHIKRMTVAVEDLQTTILNSLTQLSTNKGGALASLRLNTQNLKAVHSDVILAFANDFNAGAKQVINDFKKTEAAITAGYKALDETVKFTGVDKATMDVLRESGYKEYVSIGGTAQEKVVQSLYSNVLGGKGMADLVTDIQGTLMGAVSRTGRPLINYAKLYANDMIMNYHNDVNLKKGLDIGMDRFLYYGNIIATSRDFCKRRVGYAYTKKQILSWKAPWSGKRGDAWTYRGGWNCRHHWQPVRKKWIEDKQPAEMQNWFKEEDFQLPKPVKPYAGGRAAGTVVTPKVVPPAPVIIPPKPKTPKMPTAAEATKHMDSIEKSKGYQDVLLVQSEAAAEFKKANQAYMRSVDASMANPTDTLKAARSKAGNVVCDAKSVVMKANKDVSQYRADSFNDLIRPKKNTTPTLFIEENQLSSVKKTRENQLKNLGDMKREVGKMFHEKVTDSVPMLRLDFKKGRRAWYRHGTEEIGIGSFTDTKTLVHEFSHGVERYYPKAKRAAFEFRKQRIGNEKISAIYKGTDELGWKDKFFSHYCGKDYGSRATEIISMGVERMYVDPALFLKQDPDYFEFMLKIMWGEL